MTNESIILQNALLLSYLHSRMCQKNLDCVLHQMRVTNHPLMGKVQSKFEKLIHAHRNAMGVIEKNIDNKELLESDIEEMIDNNWKELDNNLD